MKGGIGRSERLSNDLTVVEDVRKELLGVGFVHCGVVEQAPVLG